MLPRQVWTKPQRREALLQGSQAGIEKKMKSRENAAAPTNFQQGEEEKQVGRGFLLLYTTTMCSLVAPINTHAPAKWMIYRNLKRCTVQATWPATLAPVQLVAVQRCTSIVITLTPRCWRLPFRGWEQRGR